MEIFYRKLYTCMLVTSLWLTSFLVVAATINGSIRVDNYTVSYSRTGQLSIYDDGSLVDRCNKMIRKNTSVHHLHVNGASKIEEWMDSEDEGLRNSDLSWDFTFPIRDYDGEYNSYWTVVFNNDQWRMEQYDDLNSIPPSPPNLPNNPNEIPQGLFAWESKKNFLYNNDDVDDGGKYSDIENYIFEFNDFPSISGGKPVFNHQHTMLVVWTDYTQVYFMDKSGWTIVGTFNQTRTTTPNLTNEIAISKDDTLALIQTDGEHPLTLISMSTYTMLNQFAFSGQIHRVSFYNNSIALITTPTQLYILNIQTSTFSLLTTLTSSVTTSMWDYHRDDLYICSDNTISVMSIDVSTAPYDPMYDPSMVINLEMTMTEQQTTDAIITGLTTMNSFVDVFITAALSNPFTYYFLTFINFFTISSHYVLLNMPLPSKLLSYLIIFYQQSNKNIIARFWELPFEKLTQEKVNRQKLLHVELTTDIAVGQTANFMMVVANIVLYMLMSRPVKRMSKDKFIRRALYQPITEILIGQYVTLIMPLTSPWIFFMVSSAVNTLSKANLMLQYVFFGLNVFFLFYCLIQLSERNYRKQKKASQKEKTKKKDQIFKSPMKNKALNSKISRIDSTLSSTKQEPPLAFNRGRLVRSRKVKESKSPRSPSLSRQHGKKESKKKNKTISTVDTAKNGAAKSKFSQFKPQNPVKKKPVVAQTGISAQMMQAWYLVLCNFIYPLLLVLQSVSIALMALLLVSLIGLVIACFCKAQRLNKIILASYPILFHLCFIVFHLVATNTVLIYTQIICLSTLLLGSVHHVLTILYVLLKSVLRRCRSKTEVKIDEKPQEPTMPPPPPTIIKKQTKRIAKDEFIHGKSTTKQPSESKSKAKRLDSHQKQNKFAANTQLLKSVKLKQERSNKKGLKVTESPRK